MRYLDNCFLHWYASIDTVDNLFLKLQNLHPNVRFTKEESQKQISFPDINMEVHRKQIITDIYQKPTDSQRYVPYLSSHAPHVKRNIPFNLARHICTIVDKEKTLQKRTEELQENLCKQGYPRGLVRHSIEEAKRIPKHELLEPKSKDSAEENILAFVTTFNPRNPELFNTIKETLPLLNASPKLREAMKKFKLIKSKRQPQNLKGILTRARFMFEESPDDSSDTKTSKCGKKSCGTCQFIEETSFFKFNHGHHLDPFEIRSKMNCEAKDVIYALQCGGCEKNTLEKLAT